MANSQQPSDTRNPTTESGCANPEAHPNFENERCVMLDDDRRIFALRLKIIRWYGLVGIHKNITLDVLMIMLLVNVLLIASWF